MRILIIRNYPTTFRLTNRFYNIQEIGLARALRRKGHECDVVFYTADEDETKEIDCENGPIRVFYVQAKNVLKCGVFPKRLDDLADGYDIVQISEYNQIQSWRYAKRFQNKMVLLHGPYYAPFNTRYNLMCRAVDICFLGRYKRLNTQFMTKSALAEQFLLDKGIRPECVDQVYVGIDEDVFRFTDEDTLPEFVTRVQSAKEPILLYIGRVEPRRKSLFMLDVLLQTRKRVPNARLVMVGDGDEAYKQKFQRHMEALNLTSAVDWTLKLEQKHLPPLYHKAAAFLMPTAFDIFGMVLLEAMYFSAAVVSSQCGGAMTLINHGRNGLVMQQDTVSGWADAITSLINDPDSRARMGQVASRTIREGFTWDVISENYLRSYQKKLGLR